MPFNVTRITDEERMKIPEEHRCMINYNGYHMWEIMRDFSGATPCVICKKCLERRKLDLTKEL